MQVDWLDQLEKLVSFDKETKIATFWNAAAENYLIKQRYQDYTIHFKSIKNAISANQDQFILNLASGKIVGSGKIVDFLVSLEVNKRIFLVNIDISKKLITYNAKELLKNNFESRVINGVSWLGKRNLFVKNIIGDISLLFRNTKMINPIKTQLPKDTILLCFDGLSNLCLNTKKLEDIFYFLRNNISYSYTTWLYPGPNFVLFLEKLDFYYKVVKKKQQLPLNFIQLMFITEKCTHKTHIKPFTMNTIHSIAQTVAKLKDSLYGVQIYFFDSKKESQIHFCSFYGKFNYLKRIATKFNLEALRNPLFHIKKELNENSFIKTYPLILKQKKCCFTAE